MSWYGRNYIDLNIFNIVKYFTILSVSYHDSIAILGFIVLLTMASQLVSGVMVSFSLIPDPMLIPMVRDEEDIEDMYTDDFF